MMTVVFTLANMTGGVFYVLIVAVGNVFVMALEALFVGIQVLRLEFYEIFSRFSTRTAFPSPRSRISLTQPRTRPNEPLCAWAAPLPYAASFFYPPDGSGFVNRFFSFAVQL